MKNWARPLTLFSILITLAYTWFLAGIVKFTDAGYSEAFVGRFAGTIFDLFPGSILVSMYLIAILELIACVAAVVSILKLEFFKMQFFWFRWALALSALSFAALGFGLRVIRDFQGSANLFFYLGVILICFVLVEQLETKERKSA